MLSHRKLRLNRFLSYKKYSHESSFSSRRISSSAYTLQGAKNRQQACVPVLSTMSTAGINRTLLSPEEVQNIIVSAKGTHLMHETSDVVLLGNGLLSLEIERSDCRALLGVLENAFRKIDYPLDSTSICSLLYGMQCMSSHTSEVRHFISTLHQKVSDSGQLVCTPEEMCMSMYGMRKFNGSHKDVRNLLTVLCDIYKPCPVKPLSAKMVGMLCSGLSCMSSREEIVRELLAIITPHVAACNEPLSAEDITCIVSSLSWISTEHKEGKILVDNILRLLRRSTTPITDIQYLQALNGLRHIGSHSSSGREILTILNNLCTHDFANIPENIPFRVCVRALDGLVAMDVRQECATIAMNTIAHCMRSKPALNANTVESVDATPIEVKYILSSLAAISKPLPYGSNSAGVDAVLSACAEKVDAGLTMTNAINSTEDIGRAIVEIKELRHISSEAIPGIVLALFRSLVDSEKPLSHAKHIFHCVAALQFLPRFKNDENRDEVVECLTKKLQTSLPNAWNGNQVYTSLSSLQHITGQSLPEKQLISTLCDKVRSFSRPLSKVLVSQAYSGLQHMSSKQPEPVALLKCLTTKLSKSPTTLDGTVLCRVVYSLNGMSSDCPEAHEALKVVASKIPDIDSHGNINLASGPRMVKGSEVCRGIHICNALYGLQHFNNDSEYVMDILKILSFHLSRSTDKLAMSAIGKAMYGLHNMSVECDVLSKIVRTLNDKILQISGSSVNDSVAIACMLYGIRSMNSQTEEIQDLLKILANVISEASPDMCFNEQHMALSFHGLSRGGSSTKASRAVLLGIINRVDSNPSRPPFAPDNISMIMTGIGRMNCNYVEVRQTLSKLFRLIDECTSEFSCMNIANVLYGLRSMTSDCPEVSDMMLAARRLVEHSRVDDYSDTYLGMMLLGLRSKYSHDDNVRELLVAITDKYLTETRHVELMALSGLGGLHHCHPEAKAFVDKLEVIPASDNQDTPANLSYALVGLLGLLSKDFPKSIDLLRGVVNRTSALLESTDMCCVSQRNSATKVWRSLACVLTKEEDLPQDIVEVIKRSMSSLQSNVMHLEPIQYATDNEHSIVINSRISSFGKCIEQILDDNGLGDDYKVLTLVYYHGFKADIIVAQRVPETGTHRNVYNFEFSYKHPHVNRMKYFAQSRDDYLQSAQDGFHVVREMYSGEFSDDYIREYLSQRMHSVGIL